jgi:urease gamma subunit
MSKKNTTETEEAVQTAKAPAHVEALLQNGSTVLKAKTREALAEMLNDIPADCRYAAGAIGYSYNESVYTLLIHKI